LLSKIPVQEAGAVVVDVHTHIVHDAVRDNRSAFFDAEPEFRLLYASPKSRLVSVDQTVAAMDDEGVAVSVVFGFPWRDPDTARRNNDYVIASAVRHPERVVGFCCLDPRRADAAREVERCLDSGLSGVGEMAFYDSGLNDDVLDRLDPIMAVCRSRNVPVMVHTNEPVGHRYPGKTPNTLAQIYRMITRFPDNRLILAHWGGGLFFYSLLKKEVRAALKNVWFDTAASPYLYQPAVYAVAKEIIGVDRVLLGTDFPLLKPSRYFADFHKAGLTSEEIRAIAGENAKALLNITDAE
jgi:predicted TIM-barrel fold metal-dependent hydrolase